MKFTKSDLFTHSIIPVSYSRAAYQIYPIFTFRMDDLNKNPN